MTLQDYINNLVKFLKEHPEAKDFPVIYSIDDEGNGYQKCSGEPTFMEVEDINKYHLEPILLEEDEDGIPNCVCIN